MKKGKGIKAFSLLLAALMLLCVAPQASLAALPDYLEVTEKNGFTSAPVNVPALSNGQVWVTRTPSSEGFLPTANVTLSAIGQAYNAPETNIVPNNIIFVLDISTSMQSNGKASNMANAANAAAEALCINGNKVAVVTFGTTAALARPLSTEAFRLTTTEETSGNLINVYPPTSNGTNIQAGLNKAYKELDDNLDDGATPIIILLTDGAPTYYYDDIDGLPTSGTVKGGGSSTTNTEISMTVVQAAYLKVLMPQLRIYTIGFDTDGNAAANVTLNPTSANISAYGNNLLTSLNNTRDKTSYVPSNKRSQVNYDYANGAYSASNSTGSLNTALNAIVRGIKVSLPVLESKENPDSTTLTETSYIALKDKIGENYVLGTDMTVSYKGMSYPFTYNSSTGKATYATATTAPGYNAEMARLVISYSNSSRTLTWKIPGNTLPCKDPGGTGSAQPIALTYAIKLDGENLEEGVYETSFKFWVEFTPAPDNPKYAGSEEVSRETYANTNNATYYEAVFARGTSGNRSLWTLASGSNVSSLTYRQLPTDVPAYYSAGTSPYLNITVSGKVVKLTNIEEQEAEAVFRTGNVSNAGSYTVQSFKAGGKTYSDARVTAIRNVKSGVYDITVNYNNGKYTLVFPSVSISKNTNTSAIKLIYKTATGADLVQGFSYDAALNRITLKVDTSSPAVIFRETVSSATNTQIIANAAANEYTIRQVTQNQDGTQTLTVYTLNSTSITKVVSTVIPAVERSQTEEASGTMTVKSNAIIGDITLKAENGTATAVANNLGQATVVLTFTAKAPFNNLAFALSSAKGSDIAPFTGFSVLGCSNGLTQNGSTFSAGQAGTYSITLQVSNPYTPTPDSFNLYLEGITYKTAAMNDKAIPHAANYAGQKVKVVLKSPSRH